jgi:TldD protein
MNNTEIARSILLDPTNLTTHDLDKVIATLNDAKIDAADIYFQNQHIESWRLEDSIIKGGSYNIESGVGVRAISDDKTGFAYSNELTLTPILEAAQAAKAIVRNNVSNQIAPVKIAVRESTRLLYNPLNPLLSLTHADKVDLLQRTNAAARAYDPRIIQVIVNLTAVYDVILILDQTGAVHGDIRPLIRLNVSAIAEQNGQRETGSDGGGSRNDLNWFLEQERYRTFAEAAARQALLNLEATAAPAGTMTVVLGSGWPGVLLHEAVGHGLEGDFNRKGTSAFTGRIGQQVASPYCTVVDDGTLYGRRGSLNIDDEGTPTQCTVLIENGILRGYMQDKLNARLMGVTSTGNGRRESFSSLPMPRMTNTYMLPGTYAHEEIIESVTKGLYAVNFSGGQVDITSGKFVFSTNEAYMIENGRIGRPVKGATLIGNGPDVLTRVSMVGNNLQMDQGVGSCGKDGQTIPVGIGQPTLKIDSLTVGGTQV